MEKEYPSEKKEPKIRQNENKRELPTTGGQEKGFVLCRDCWVGSQGVQ